MIWYSSARSLTMAAKSSIESVWYSPVGSGETASVAVGTGSSFSSDESHAARTATVIMMISPNGDFKIPIPGGYYYGSVGSGWANSGIMNFEGLELFGTVTGMTKYVEKLVP